MKVQISEINEVILSVLKKFGYSNKESEIIRDILLFAQLRGNNQGVVKLIGNGIPRRDDDGEIKITNEAPSSALINGNKNHAMVVMDYAADLAIKKARENGISVVGNYNSSESTGALGYYIEKIAKNDLIGIAYASAPFQSTAPFGSIDALFCTNPIAYGIPTINDPILLDFSTSEIAYFGLIEANLAGEMVTEGTGYDSDGKETNDPSEIMAGAIKSFAGHKGSGLALIVQILAGPLIKAAYFETGNNNAGNLLMAINPNMFSGIDYIKEKIEDMKLKIQNSRKVEGVKEILLPGERGYKLYHDSILTGILEIEDSLWSELKKVADNK